MLVLLTIKEYDTLWRERKFPELHALITPLAETKCDPIAMQYLARCLEGGYGCEPDNARSEEVRGRCAKRRTLVAQALL